MDDQRASRKSASGQANTYVPKVVLLGLRLIALATVLSLFVAWVRTLDALRKESTITQQFEAERYKSPGD